MNNLERNLILKHFDILDFKDTFPLASFGARVCYTNGRLDELLNDHRIIDPDDRVRFLSKLCNHKHFSVFSHSFTYKKVGELDALKIAATNFKSYYDPENPEYIGISLRHYLESLSDSERISKLDILSKHDTQISPVSSKGNVTLLYVCPNYAVFYIQYISRVATHQLIRHSSLNFSQRSQRYVKEDGNDIILPPSVMENISANRLMLQIDYYCQQVYKTLVYEYRVKREDARFILPSGRKTSIVVSGPIKWIRDFIEKRKHPHAQWEIREVANIMEELLDNNS